MRHRQGALSPEATAPTDDDVVRGRFPAHYAVSASSREGRYEVHDPASRSTWALGGMELAAARCFDGVQTYRSISMALRTSGLRPISPASLRAFEQRLLELGVLVDARQASRRRSRRPLSYVLAVDRFEFASFDPTRLLDVVYRRLFWLQRRPWTLLVPAIVVATFVWLATRFDRFVNGVPMALRGWGLLGLYAVCAVATVFHEGGHALSCRKYGVAVHEVGIGMQSLLVSAWTVPDQDAWSGLSRRQRVVTVVAGPFAGLGFSAIGALLWLLPAPGPLPRLGVLMTLAGTVFGIPTLLPIFNGDAYLLLTDMFNWPNLRSRSFQYLRSTCSGHTEPVGTGTKIAYIGFAVATILGRVAMSLFVVWLIWVCAVRAKFR